MAVGSSHWEGRESLNQETSHEPREGGRLTRHNQEKSVSYFLFLSDSILNDFLTFSLHCL